MGDAKRFMPLYLVVDHHPETPEEIRFLFNVFKMNQGILEFYNPSNNTNTCKYSCLIKLLKHIF